MKNAVLTFFIIISLTGCASFCKPHKAVIETVEQEGRLLNEINARMKTSSDKELKSAIQSLIESNRALRKYLSIKEENNDE